MSPTEDPSVLDKMQQARGFKAAEEDLVMPPFGDIKHAEAWGMSEAKYQKMKAAKRAGFKKIRHSRDPRVVPNIPGTRDEPGSRILPTHATMPMAENELKENKKQVRGSGCACMAREPRDGKPGGDHGDRGQVDQAPTPKLHT